MKKIFLFITLTLSILGWSQSCPNLCYNGDFEIGSPPYCCGLNCITYCTDVYIGRANGWTDEWQNNSDDCWAFDANYKHTAVSGPCVGTNPPADPHGGSGHAELVYANDVSYNQHQGDIISSNGTILPLTMGACYEIEFYFKVNANPNNGSFDLVVYLNDDFQSIKFGNGTLFPCIVTPDANGWMKAKANFVSPYNGTVYFGITVANPQYAASGQKTIIYIDDVSFRESISLSYAGPSPLCVPSSPNALLTANCTGSPTWTIQPSVGIQYTTFSNALSITNVNVTGTYTISATGVNASGCTSSASVILNAASSPSVTISPGSASWCSNDLNSVLLTASPFNPLYNYQWYDQNGPLVGETNFSFNATAAGNYYAVATNS